MSTLKPMEINTVATLAKTSPLSPAARPPHAKRTILVAVDGSDHSKYAFKWSLDNIVRPDGQDWVVLCTSKGGDSKAQAGWHEVIFDDSAAPSSKTAEQDMAEKSRIQNLLGSYASELSKKMIPGRSVVLQGDARQALVGKAQELHADVMIMGSRGMAGIKKAIMGSVSDYCVHNAHCPVLIVRKPM